MAKWSSQCFRSSCSLNLPWLFLCYLLHFKAWVLSCPVVSHLLFPSFLIFPDLYRVLEFLSSHLAPNCNRLQQTTLMILMSFAAALDHRDCCSNVHGYVAKAHLWQSRIKSLWFRTYTTYTGNIWKHWQTEFLCAEVSGYESHLESNQVHFAGRSNVHSCIHPEKNSTWK